MIKIYEFNIDKYNNNFGDNLYFKIIMNKFFYYNAIDFNFNGQIVMSKNVYKKYSKHFEFISESKYILAKYYNFHIIFVDILNTNSVLIGDYDQCIDYLKNKEIIYNRNIKLKKLEDVQVNKV